MWRERWEVLLSVQVNVGVAREEGVHTEVNVGVAREEGREPGGCRLLWVWPERRVGSRGLQVNVGVAREEGREPWVAG